MLLYAHGTEFDKAKDMTDTAGDLESSLVMALFASQGYIVVAPNYLGYADSSLNFHPYLNAEAQAADVVDALRAATAHLKATATTQPSAQLFVAGYSQGGHVAMAAHKVLERDHAAEFTVTASGPMSGPYNMVGFLDRIIIDERPNAGATLLFPLLLTSYQFSFGNMYSDPADIYNAPFDQFAETLFPNDAPVEQLVLEGRIPINPAEGANQTFTNLVGDGGLLKA